MRLPANPLLQLAPPRVYSLVNRLKAQLWQRVAPVACEATEPTRVETAFADAPARPRRVVQAPYYWGKKFEHCWFRLDVPPDAAATPAPRFLCWQDQGEATLYLDGVPFYGFDLAHRHAPLPAGFSGEAWVEAICLQTGIWCAEGTPIDHDFGSRWEGAALMRRDEAAWTAYHDLAVLFELLQHEWKANAPLDPNTWSYGPGFHSPVESVSPLYRRLSRRLDDAVNAHDAGGLPALAVATRALYEELREEAPLLKGVLTGHAHIDLVWLWPESIGVFKATHTFSTALRTMETYPEFRLGYSQPASYEAVGRRTPRLLEQVRGRIADGRWEATGATYVESDTILACGEALARSFLVGQQGFADLRAGEPSRVLWLPDVFGYSACLPQLMRGTGVEAFFTTKLTWGNVTRFPFSSFVWRGHDGSEVLSHVTQDAGYNCEVTVAQADTCARAYRQSDVHDEFLIATGYGDGGGGPTEQMCERARRLTALRGMPALRWGGIEDFFADLEKVRAKLPVYQGELYLEYHRGTLTSHGRIKDGFRGLERALQSWEAARCALGKGEIDARFWERLIFAQFHDYIPGSSIAEVYEEATPELRSLVADALERCGRELGEAGGEPAVFNPLPLPRREIVTGGDGRQRLVELPPLAGRHIATLPDVPDLALVQAGRGFLDNGRVRAEFDGEGQISRLVIDGEPVALAEPMGGLMLYPDKPHAFDAWDVDRQTLSLGEPVRGLQALPPEGAGGLEGSMIFHGHLGKHSQISTRYILRAGEGVLRIEHSVDWWEPHALLKQWFPSGYAGRFARFGAPFGSVQRGQQVGQPTDEACFESVGSRWATVSDDGEREGIFVVTEARYGFTCREGAVGVSLLRNAGMTDALPLTQDELADPRAHVEGVRRKLTDVGPHTVRLAIGRLAAGGPREESPAALCDVLFTPAVPYAGAETEASLLGLEGGPSLTAAWAKPARDGNGWILRLNETRGHRGVCRVRLAAGWKAERTDLREAPATGQMDGVATEVVFAPYELISLRVYR